MSEEAKNKAIELNKCGVCGRFMKRIGLVSRVRLEVECGIIRTHICVKEEFTFSTKEYKHN